MVAYTIDRCLPASIALGADKHSLIVIAELAQGAIV